MREVILYCPQNDETVVHWRPWNGVPVEERTAPYVILIRNNNVDDFRQYFFIDEL